HEVHQRTFQRSAQVPINGKARTRDLRGAFEVEHAQRLAQLPVGLGSKVELRRRAPLAYLDIVIGRLADRNAVLRQVGESAQDVAHSRVESRSALLCLG